jgi:hypothetical protein
MCLGAVELLAMTIKCLPEIIPELEEKGIDFYWADGYNELMVCGIWHAKPRNR